MTKEEFENMLLAVLKSGVTVSMKMDNGLVWYDMNTGMKSDLQVTLVGSVGMYKSRYDDGTFSGLDELVELVRSCKNGRSFYNQDWNPLLYPNGKPGRRRKDELEELWNS